VPPRAQWFQLLPVPAKGGVENLQCYSRSRARLPEASYLNTYFVPSLPFGSVAKVPLIEPAIDFSSFLRQTSNLRANVLGTSKVVLPHDAHQFSLDRCRLAQDCRFKVPQTGKRPRRLTSPAHAVICDLEIEGDVHTDQDKRFRQGSTGCFAQATQAVNDACFIRCPRQEFDRVPIPGSTSDKQDPLMKPSRRCCARPPQQSAYGVQSGKSPKSGLPPSERRHTGHSVHHVDGTVSATTQPTRIGTTGNPKERNLGDRFVLPCSAEGVAINQSSRLQARKVSVSRIEFPRLRNPDSPKAAPTFRPAFITSPCVTDGVD
jgi:hypothetical protein